MEEKRIPYLTKESIETLDHLFSTVDPLEMREHLLELYHGYLVYSRGNLPVNFESIALTMYHLSICLTDVKRE